MSEQEKEVGTSLAQKAHEPTPESRHIVLMSSGFGLPQDQICALIGGIDEKTLRRYYRTELDLGIAQANSNVGKRLYQKAAVEGDATALIWWTKTRMGWKDTSRVEVTGADGQPIEFRLADDARSRMRNSILAAAVESATQQNT